MKNTIYKWLMSLFLIIVFPSLAQLSPLTIQSEPSSISGLDNYVLFNSNTNDAILSTYTANREPNNQSPFTVISPLQLTAPINTRRGTATTDLLIDTSKDFNIEVEVEFDSRANAVFADGFSFNFYSNSRGFIGGGGGQVGSNIPFSDGMVIRTFTAGSAPPRGIYTYRNLDAPLTLNQYTRLTNLSLQADGSYYVRVIFNYTAADNNMNASFRFIKKGQCVGSCTVSPNTINYSRDLPGFFNNATNGTPWRYFSIASATGGENARHLILTSNITANIVNPNQGLIFDANDNNIIENDEGITYEAAIYNTNRTVSRVGVQLPRIIGEGLDTNAIFIDNGNTYEISYQIKNPLTKEIISSGGPESLVASQIVDGFYEVEAPATTEVFFSITTKMMLENDFFESDLQRSPSTQERLGIILQSRNSLTSEVFTDSVIESFEVPNVGATELRSANAVVIGGTIINDVLAMCNLLSVSISDEIFPDRTAEDFCTNAFRTTIKIDDGTVDGSLIAYPYTFADGFNVENFIISYTSGVEGNNKVSNARVNEIIKPTLTVDPSQIEVSVGASVDINAGVSADLQGENIDQFITSSPILDVSKVGVTIITYTLNVSGFEPISKNRTYIVRSESSVISGDVLIDAKNVTDLLANKDSIVLLDRTSATAFDTLTGEEITGLVFSPIDLTDNAIYDRAGVYPIDITTPVGTSTGSKRVTVTLTDSDSNISPNDTVFIFAKNINSNVTDAVGKTVIAESSARANLTNDGSELSVRVKAPNSDDLGSYAAGFYLVSIEAFNAEGVSETRDITITITDDNSVFMDNIFITADDFRIHINDIPRTNLEITNSQYIDVLGAGFANASAFDVLTAQPINNLTTFPVSLSMYSIVGVHPFTITATEGGRAASITVYVTVFDDDSVFVGDLFIDANNIIRNFEDRALIDLIPDSNVVAYNTQTGASSLDSPSTIVVTSDRLDLSDAPSIGMYDVTFTATETGNPPATKTIKVSLFGNDTLIKGNVRITGSNFTMRLSDVGLTSDTSITNPNSILSLGIVSAEISGSAITDIIVEPVDLTHVTRVGIEPINLKVNDDTVDPVEIAEHPIVAVITTNEPSKAPTEEKIILDANNFIIHIDDLIGADYDIDYKMLSNAIAYNLDSNDSVGEIVPEFTFIGNPIISDIRNITDIGIFEINVSAKGNIYDSATGDIIGEGIAVKTIFMTVVDEDTDISENVGNILLHAVNFEATVQEADNSDRNFIVSEGEVIAIDFLTNTNLTSNVIFNDLSSGSEITDLKGSTFDTSGAYPINATITEGTETAEKLIYAIITDSNDSKFENNVFIKANDFIVSVQEIANSPLNSRIRPADKSNPEAFDAAVGIEIPLTSIISSPLLLTPEVYSSPGVFDVEFCATGRDGVGCVTVKMTVIDENSVVDNGILLFAQSFSTSIADADMLFTTQESMLIATLARAENTDGDDSSINIITTPNHLDNSPVYDVVGVYPIKVDATNAITTLSATRFVTVTIINNEDNISKPNGEVFLNAENFTVSLEEADAINDFTKLKDISKTTAFDTDVSVDSNGNQVLDVNGNPILQALTPVFTNGLGEVITDLTGSIFDRSGVYPIIVTAQEEDSSGNPVADGEVATVTIYVTVTGNDSEILANPNILLNAHSFEINADDVATVVLSDVTGAEAFETSTGVNITDNITFDPTQDFIRTDVRFREPGVYSIDVRASTSSNILNTSKTIHMTVRDDNSFLTSDYLFDANSFIDLFANKNNIILLDSSSAQAINRITGLAADDITISFSINGNQVNDLSGVNEAGVYPIVVLFSNGTDISQSIPITATLTDDNSLISAGGELFIFAKDIVVNLADVDDTDIVSESGAFATLISDGSNVPVSVVPTDLTDALFNSPGLYPDIVTINAQTTGVRISASKLIDVTILDDGSADLALSADNFIISLADIASADLLELSNAQVSVGGISVDLPIVSNVDLSSITEVGVYPIELSTTDGINSNNITIYVTVTDETTSLSDGNEIILGASSFVTNIIDADIIFVDETSILGDLGAKTWFANTFDGSTDRINVSADVKSLAGDVTYDAEGVYPIVITATSTDDSSITATKTVYVAITGDNSEVDNGIFIFAKDIISTVSSKDLVDILAEEHTDVVAIHISDNSIIPTENISSDPPDLTSDEFNTVRTYVDRVAITAFKVSGAETITSNTRVSVTIIDDRVNDAEILANDFAISINGIGDGDIIELSDAIVIGSDGFEDPSIEIISDLELDSITRAGVYKAVLTTEDGVSFDIEPKTIYITVFDDTSSFTDNYLLDAENFTDLFVNKDNINLLDSTNTVVYDRRNGELVTDLVINFEPVDLRAVTEPGVTEIVITIEDEPLLVTNVNATLTGNEFIASDIRPISFITLLTELSLLLVMTIFGFYHLRNKAAK